MLFSTPDDREMTLAALESNPRLVPYGAALDHAATTNLGIWGDRDALFRDCAAIMAAEVSRFAIEEGDQSAVRDFDTGRRFAPANCRPDDVLASRVFAAAFARARRETEVAMSEALASLGRWSENQHLLRAAQVEREAEPPGHLASPDLPPRELCRAVYDELRSMRF